MNVTKACIQIQRIFRGFFVRRIVVNATLKFMQVCKEIETKMSLYGYRFDFEFKSGRVHELGDFIGNIPLFDTSNYNFSNTNSQCSSKSELITAMEQKIEQKGFNSSAIHEDFGDVKKMSNQLLVKECEQLKQSLVQRIRTLTRKKSC